MLEALPAPQNPQDDNILARELRRSKTQLISAETRHPGIYIAKDGTGTGSQEMRSNLLRPECKLLAYPLPPLEDMQFSPFVRELAEAGPNSPNEPFIFKHVGSLANCVTYAFAAFALSPYGRKFGNLLDQSLSTEQANAHPAKHCYQFVTFLCRELLALAGQNHTHPNLQLIIHNAAPRVDLTPHTDLNDQYYENGRTDGPQRLRLLCGFLRARGTAVQMEDNLKRETLDPFLREMHDTRIGGKMTKETEVQVRARLAAIQGHHFVDPEFEWEIPLGWGSVHKIGRHPADPFSTVHYALPENLKQPGVLFHITCDLVE